MEIKYFYKWFHVRMNIYSVLNQKMLNKWLINAIRNAIYVTWARTVWTKVNYNRQNEILRDITYAKHSHSLQEQK